MDSLKSLIENTVNVFFAALATAIASRIVNRKWKRKMTKKNHLPRRKRKGGSSRH